MVYYIEENPIAVAENAVVDFQDGPAPQICFSVLGLVCDDVRENLIEQGGQQFRRLSGVRRRSQNIERGIQARTTS